VQHKYKEFHPAKTCNPNTPPCIEEKDKKGETTTTEERKLSLSAPFFTPKKALSAGSSGLIYPPHMQPNMSAQKMQSEGKKKKKKKKPDLAKIMEE
jgi:hypothetical protein